MSTSDDGCRTMRLGKIDRTNPLTLSRLPRAGVVERAEHERAAERRRAIGRIRAEGFQDRALQRGPDCDGAQHPGPSTAHRTRGRVARPASQKVRDNWRNAELLV